MTAALIVAAVLAAFVLGAALGWWARRPARRQGSVPLRGPGAVERRHGRHRDRG